MANIKELEHTYGGLETNALLEEIIKSQFPGRIALVSSFGADAAVLLHMVSVIDRATPVVFIDTHRLFEETKTYRDLVVEQLQLTDVRTISPLVQNVSDLDAKGVLWATEPNRCCYFRKVLPLHRALEGFDAWITGRKQYQNDTRAKLPVFELADQRVKVNPLISWKPDQVKQYLAINQLPEHPLVAHGYPSIGCQPCTSPLAPDEDARAGRWRGQAKTECGIHLSSSAPPAGQGNRLAPRAHGCG